MQIAQGEGPSRSFLSAHPVRGTWQPSTAGRVEAVIVDQLGLTSYEFDRGRIFVLWGELDASTCRGLTEHLVVGLPGSLIVLDLRRLTFMDSSGLGAIHAARRRAIDNGGTLVLSRPNPVVYQVLQSTGLDIWVTDWDPKWTNRSAVDWDPS